MVYIAVLGRVTIERSSSSINVLRLYPALTAIGLLAPPLVLVGARGQVALILLAARCS